MTARMVFVVGDHCLATVGHDDARRVRNAERRSKRKPASEHPKPLDKQVLEIVTPLFTQLAKLHNPDQHSDECSGASTLDVTTKVLPDRPGVTTPQPST
jgi:hypothetical protein